MIWVLSGTESGRELVSALLQAGTPVLVSTGTEYRKDLYSNHPGLTYIPGKLKKEDMAALVKEYSVELIIDATHSYSVDVTSNAIDTSRVTGTRYIRYEKKPVELHGTLEFREYSEASSYLEEKKGNIMLLTGTHTIKSFSRIPPERLFVRIVPFLNSVEEAISSGIRPGHIVAMSFRMSREFNAILYRDLEIEFLVTKEPGDTAGMREIIESAIEGGVEILVVRRPKIDYPELVDEIDGVLEIING
jgi:precorrin-6A/cobalt-precorrin-6A reductase